MTDNKPLQLITEIQTFNKETASISEIAEYLCQDSHSSNAEAVKLALLYRITSGDFEYTFSPGMPSELQTGELTLGNNNTVATTSNILEITQSLYPYLEAAISEAILVERKLSLDYDKILLPLQNFTWGNNTNPESSDLLNQVIERIKNSIFSRESKNITVQYNRVKYIENEPNSAERNKIHELCSQEEKKLKLALAKIIYMPKKMFHQWVRAERYLQNYQYECGVPEYNGFWGDAWKGYGARLPGYR